MMFSAGAIRSVQGRIQVCSQFASSLYHPRMELALSVTQDRR